MKFLPCSDKARHAAHIWLSGRVRHTCWGIPW